MLPFRSSNNTDPHSNVMSDFLLCIRTQSDNLTTLVRSHNQLNNLTSDVMNLYYSDRSVVRQREIFRNYNNLTSSTPTSDISNNTSRAWRPPPPTTAPPAPRMPPPPPPTELDSGFRPGRFRPRPRRTGTNWHNIRNSRIVSRENFINSTLWSANPMSFPASIKNILDNTTLCIWKDIKDTDTYRETERCPIDLSILSDDDYMLKITSCSHVFKRTNILRWFALNSKCPVCRCDIARNILPPTDPSNNTTNAPVSPRNIAFSVNDDTSNNTFEELRRRVTDLLAQSDLSGNSIIAADITFEIPMDPPIN